MVCEDNQFAPNNSEVKKTNYIDNYPTSSMVYN